MSLFNNFYQNVLQEAREKTLPSTTKTKKSSLQAPEEIKASLEKLKIPKLKELMTDKDNIDLALDIFNIVRALKDEDLIKSDLTRNDIFKYILSATKTDYHDSDKMTENDIVRFKMIGRNALMKLNIPVDKKIKLNAQIPRWHNLYDMIFQEIYGKDTDEYREKAKSYTKRDVSTSFEEGKIEKAIVYYFDGDPDDPDSKPFRTTIIIPPNNFNTKEEMENNVPIAKSFWNEPKTGKPAPWPFMTFTPKQLRNKTVNEIRAAVNSSEAEKAHKKLYPENDPKYAELYTLK